MGSFIEGIREADLKFLFFDFDGRIGRRDYWIGILLLIVIGIVVGFVGSLVFPIFFQAIFVSLLQVIILVPSFALQVKRWHDRNKSAWWCLLNLVPVIGTIWVFVEQGFLPSVDLGNEY